MVPATFTIELENEFKKTPHVEILSCYCVAGYEQMNHNGVGTVNVTVSNITNNSFDFTIGKWTNYAGEYNLSYVVVGI